MKTHRHPPTLLGVLLFASVTGAAELHVPRDHGTIQGAIDAAADGDEVVVAQGRYLENDLGTRGKKITIRSTDPTDRAVVDATVIDGGEASGSFKFFETGEGSTTVISGLTLTRASNQPGAYIYRSSPTFSHCVFRGFESNHESAIKPAESSSRFIDCVFQDNHVTEDPVGQRSVTSPRNSRPMLRTRLRLAADRRTLFLCRNEGRERRAWLFLPGSRRGAGVSSGFLGGGVPRSKGCVQGVRADVIFTTAWLWRERAGGSWSVCVDVSIGHRLAVTACS